MKSKEHFLNDNDLLEYLLKKGIREFKAKKYEEAKKYFDEIMRMYDEEDLALSGLELNHLFLLRGITNYHLENYVSTVSDVLKTLKPMNGLFEYNFKLAYYIEFHKLNSTQLNIAADALTILLELINNPIKYKLNKNILIKGINNLYIIYWARAFIFKKLKKFKKSLLDFNRSIINIPKLDFLPWLYSDRAFVHMEKGNYLDAINDINKAINKDSFCYRTYLAMGMIYIHFSNFNFAISMFDKSIDIMDCLYGNLFTPMAKAYILRGFSKIHYQNIENGIEDIGLGLACDKNCLETCKTVFQNIDEGIKNIIRIRFNVSIKD